MQKHEKHIRAKLHNNINKKDQCQLAVAQKTGTQNGTLASGNMDHILRFAPPPV